MSLETGKTINGFYVEKEENLPEYNGRIYIMRHVASKARLMYVQNDDVNKAFSIAFKTPPVDDTGVFHILEHSVLNGSRKFPVKEPFVNLIKNSMQTFLNAMTFSDKTVFPVASTNERDLMNLADVYMDAVLHPAIYDRPTIFMQEGWHVELEEQSIAGDEIEFGEQDDTPESGNTLCKSDSNSETGLPALFYNGVVYNEMRGALSEPESVLVNALCAALFPDTTYRFESGGTPGSIPDLTYEKFLDTHARHYRLDNAYITLYGDLDAENFLAFLDEKYLTPDANLHKDAGAPNPLDAQPPVKSLGNVVKMRTTEDNACMAIGYAAGDVHDNVRMECIDILLDALAVNNESPLKRALLDANLGSDISIYLHDDVIQPFATVMVKGLRPGCDERLHETITSEIERLASGGLDHELVEAAISHAEFTMRERDFGISDGVALAITSLGGWLYDDDLATSYMHYETLFPRMRELLNQGYFEQLMRELFLENDHEADVRLIPVDVEEPSPADNRLAAQSHALTIEQRDEIAATTEQLREAQNRTDTPEELATLPHLGINDIGDVPAETKPTLEDTPFGTVLRHHVETSGITYANRYYDLNNLSVDDLPYVSLLCLFLGRLNTVWHTANELSIIAQSKLGNLSVSTKNYSSKDDADTCWLKLSVSGSALYSNTAELAKTSCEICLGTKFTDIERMRDILVQKKFGMETDFSNNGNKFAGGRAAAKETRAAAIGQRLAGVDFYLFLTDLLDHFDERFDEVSKHLEMLAATIFSNTDCLVSFTGGDEELASYHSAIEQSRNSLISIVPQFDRVPMPGLEIEKVTPGAEAFIVPTDVTYTAIALDHLALNSMFPHDGSWLLASRALTYNYLWNEVRVKGGAYGVSFVLPRVGCARFSSYRDPHIDETVERFEGAADWIETYDASPEEWEGLVVSTVAGMDTPLKPRALINRQDTQFISGIDPQLRVLTRQQVIRSTPEDCRALAPLIRSIVERGGRVVFGARDAIEGSSLDWHITTLIG